jgi:hypothetical protein
VRRPFNCPIGGPLAPCHELATINVGRDSDELRARTDSRSSVIACFIAWAGARSGPKCRDVGVNRIIGTCDRGDGVRSGTSAKHCHHLLSLHMRRGLRTRKGGGHE